MSYRSVKKILGENSLERKCRILFGVSMLLLIGSSFFAVSQISEELVYDATRRVANKSIATEFMRVHMVERQGGADDMFRELSAYLGDTSYTVETVTLSKTASRLAIFS